MDDPDKKDERGWADLHYAAAYGRRQDIKALARAGANMDLRTADGRRPREIAMAAGHERAAMLIEEYLSGVRKVKDGLPKTVQYKRVWVITQWNYDTFRWEFMGEDGWHFDTWKEADNRRIAVLANVGDVDPPDQPMKLRLQMIYVLPKEGETHEDSGTD